MIRRYLAMIMIASTMLLSGCSRHERKTENAIDDLKAETIAYYWQNRELLLQLSEKFLQILSTRTDLYSIQVYVGQNRLDGFDTEGGYTVLNQLVYQEIANEMKSLEENAAHISIVSATTNTNYFSSRSCNYVTAVWDDDSPYYKIEIVYCEDRNTEVYMPEFTEQIDDNWYLMCYYLP